MSKFYEVAINAELSKYIKLDEIMSIEFVGEDKEFAAIKYYNGEKDSFTAASLVSAFAHAEIGLMSMQVQDK
ncbi:MAG: hypothetical protein ACRC42_02410 [Mycoplasma sp.]